MLNHFAASDKLMECNEDNQELAVIMIASIYKIIRYIFKKELIFFELILDL